MRVLRPFSMAVACKARLRPRWNILRIEFSLVSTLCFMRALEARKRRRHERGKHAW
jgi:hypothetical protein